MVWCWVKSQPPSLRSRVCFCGRFWERMLCMCQTVTAC